MGILQRFIPGKKTGPTDFELSYQTHYKTIYRRVAYLTGDVHVAEELTQEVFIKLYQNPPKHENTIAWLNTVAARVAYNYMRDDKNHQKIEAAELVPQWVSHQTPETMYLEAEELRLTHQALSELSLKERTCLLMKHSGYKYSEIADCLEMDSGSVGTLISRAQAKFKATYETYLKQGGLE